MDGAIHAAAGPELVEASMAQAPCPTGEARITPGFRLPATWVIHTPGPVWSGGQRNEAELLARCYCNSLRLAEEAGARTLAFPSISTGVYRYPVGQAARIALAEIDRFLAEHDLPEQVTVVCFDERTYRSYQESAREMGLSV